MGNTYEFENSSKRLETYEWDNSWLDHAGTQGVPRVMYIGDSISRANWGNINALADGKIFFDGFATSKALDNPYFYDSLRLFADQQMHRSAIVINNGLHGWHLDDTTEYKEHYENMIRFLLEEFKGTPIMLVLTTAVSDMERDARVVVRNNSVIELAEKYDLPVIDFYSVVSEHRDQISQDGVHLLADGYKLLAELLVKSVKEYANL